MSALWTSAEAAAATGGRAGGTWSANGVSIDTRTLQPGDLFFALIGERDGHDFVKAAIEKGAAAALVSKAVPGVDAAKLLVTGDTQAGLEALGRMARSRVNAGIAAITGSAGKTSTKEALRFVLGRQGTTHASEASYNNLWGVPLTLARMPQATKYGIFEIGMNHADEIRPLTRQVRPDVAMVTTVEAVHLAHFGSVEEIANAKAEIFEGLPQGGVAVINADNPHAARLAAAATRAGARVWTFGEKGAEARLASVSLGEASSEIEADILGSHLRFTYGAPGRHFVQNALGLLLVVKALGADVAAAAEALRGVRAAKGRGERVRIETVDGAFDLIDEAYNANPASMAAALAVLGSAKPGPGGRRIAVIGDMLELGPQSDVLHAGLAGAIAESGADLVFACGASMAHLWAQLPVSIRGAYAQASSDIASLVAADTRPGDVVMVKGSLGSRMALVVDALKARARELAAG
ncbi:MAG: UDP-N-acetylmuramoylalanyl-D-glutamyl-2,6-diaminopimelate--D-alanyl-D-alanine ligase [Alphaproteobacteria bacterium]|nr:UDP-N-acetylmuramoylalanyl-D-glutamyl-2,6-diaminopimelate--D-alanyl-D-alanine ligase [Alphaproteobacteria bacterium]